MTASLYEWLLFLHVVAGMAWLGGTLVVSVLAAVVLRGAEREDVARFVRSLRFVGPAVLAPATTPRRCAGFARGRGAVA